MGVDRTNLEGMVLALWATDVYNRLSTTVLHLRRAGLANGSTPHA